MAENFKPAELSRRDPERTRRYRELLAIYQGTQWQTRERPGEKHLTFNYARVIIDKLASYLMSGVKIVVDPGNDTAAEWEKARRAEQALARVYEDNNLEQLDFETEVDCAVLGDACYKVVRDAADGGIRVTAPDAQGIYLWTEADDISRPHRVASRYTLDARAAGDLYQIKPKGKTSVMVELWTAQEFELWADDVRIEKKANPYSFIPFIIFPNLRAPKQCWGVSDLELIIEPQREFNRAMSQLSRILELSGNPIAVLENVETSEDIAIYAYGQNHAILKGQYRTGAREVNRVQVTGYAPGSGENIIADSFDWGQIEKICERPREITDRNLSTMLQVIVRGEAVLRKTEISSHAGEITVPVNCGQQLYDVVEISDASAGLTASKRRILGISLIYHPEKREYLQKMDLGRD